MHLQAAIAAVQQTATARVIAMRQAEDRRVAQATEDAENAKAAQIKAEAELANFRSKLGERVRDAVLKTSAKERERSAQALAAQSGRSYNKLPPYENDV